ncbi:hypothetical protein [Amycolatopsis sp. cmx-4-83]|uniref:hypothetical protein n=1 Tax=Amycolatopsis sp. cmx-4-83 TaxID=2790940 RepID=UPI0039781962
MDARERGLTAGVLTAGVLVAAGGRTAIPALVTTAISPVASTSEVPYPDLPSVAAGVADAVTAVSPGTDVGFVRYDRESGEEQAALDADRAYYTASVVKLLIAIDEVRDETGAWAFPDADAVGTRTAALIGQTHTTPGKTPCPTRSRGRSSRRWATRGTRPTAAGTSTSASPAA